MIQLESILNIAHGKIVCILDDHSQAFSNAKEAIESGLYKHCIVSGISVHDNAILLNLQPFQTPITQKMANGLKSIKAIWLKFQFLPNNTLL